MYKYSLPGRLAVWWIVNGKWLRGMQAVRYMRGMMGTYMIGIHDGYIHDGVSSQGTVGPIINVNNAL